VTAPMESDQTGGGSVRLICVPVGADRSALGELLEHAGLAPPMPVVALVGGAAGLDPRDAAVCARLFSQALAPAIEKMGACLVDGGTASGIMALAGQARRAVGASGPHVGVAAAGTVNLPGTSRDPQAADLDSNHSHIVVVPGDNWGDEAPWLSDVATILSATAPSVTVLANGGSIAHEDVRHSLAAKRPVLVLAGTGRTAAEIVAARAGSMSASSRVAELAAVELVTIVPDDPAALTAELTERLRM
jgi:SLOG in TRPM, prokaryote